MATQINNNKKSEKTPEQELKTLKEQNKKLKDQNEEQKLSFEKRFLKMQEQIESLLNNGLVQNTKTENLISEETEILVGCRAFSGATLSNVDGSISIVFVGGEEKYIEIEDMKSLLKENVTRNNKLLFMNGLFYFVNEEYYKKFNIKKNIDLSEKNIIDILLTPDIDKMINKVKDLTNDKHNTSVTHTFQFFVAKLLVDSKHPLAMWKYESRMALETYLENKFDELIAYSGVYQLLKELGRR